MGTRSQIGRNDRCHVRGMKSEETLFLLLADIRWARRAVKRVALATLRRQLKKIRRLPEEDRSPAQNDIIEKSYLIAKRPLRRRTRYA